MRPIFLLSLPRTGSTLTQRVLGSHPEIATYAEPWVLLSPLYAIRPRGARAAYWHSLSAMGVVGFCNGLPGGQDEYLAAVRDFALTLYRGAGGSDATYFLDKTPRYHCVATELLRVFPDAKLVFLWRQPLDVLASFVQTYRAGRFEPYNFAIDLFDGVANLVEAWQQLRHRAHAVRYEDLVAGGAQPWRGIFDYLELDFDPTVLTRFADTEPGGAPPDVRVRPEISDRSVGAWRAVAGSHASQAWCRRYIRWIGPERMAAMGYDHDALLREIANLPARGLGYGDVLHLASSLGAHRFRRLALSFPESPPPIGPGFPVDRHRRRRWTRKLLRVLTTPEPRHSRSTAAGSSAAGSGGTDGSSSTRATPTA